MTPAPDAPLDAVVRDVTARIGARSKANRAACLERLGGALTRRASRGRLWCANLAHVFAAADARDKAELRAARWPSLAIVSTYNDPASAHQHSRTTPR